jgi:hypothetical protein
MRGGKDVRFLRILEIGVAERRLWGDYRLPGLGRDSAPKIGF